MDKWMYTWRRSHVPRRGISALTHNQMPTWHGSIPTGGTGSKVEAINTVNASHLLTVRLTWRAEPTNDT